MLKIALLGLGWWGSKLLRNFLAHPGVGEVVGIDPSDARRQEARSTFGIDTRPSAEEALGVPDIAACAIATPPRTHFDLARSALIAGKDVFLTKPPTETLDELRELVDIARIGKRVFMMDSTFVYSPAIRRIGDLVRSGLFREVRFVQSLRYGNDLRMHDVERLRTTMLDNGLSVIDDLLFHDVAILSYLFPDVPLRPQAVHKVNTLSSVLCDTAFIRFDTGSFPVHVALSWTLPERRRELLIADGEKQLVFDDLKNPQKIELFHVEDKRSEAVPHGEGEPLLAVVDHFVSCVATRATPFTDGPYMVKVMEAFAAARRLP